LTNSLPDNEITARIEAALYSAGRPLQLDELLKASGTNSRSKTRAIVEGLIVKAKSAFLAIEIAELENETFVFQLKAGYTPLARKFAQRPLIPGAALKTLSYIAYEQPVASKRLAQVRGSQVYSHLKTLGQMRFIEHENLGRLKIYRTTSKFQSYFGVTDIETLKSALPMKGNPERKKNKTNENSDPNAASASSSSQQYVKS
jgi:segregation and condensation protein B